MGVWETLKCWCTHKMLMYALNADVRIRCWCTHLTLMYAFDWHELINGDVLPGTISFFATIWGQGTNAIMQLCSGCNKGWHTTCFQIPPREWVCEANKCWCTHLIDTSLYTEAFIRNKLHRQRCGTGTNATMQLCSGCNEGRHTTCLQNPPRGGLIEGNKCWCTHKMLMYA